MNDLNPLLMNRMQVRHFERLVFRLCVIAAVVALTTIAITTCSITSRVPAVPHVACPAANSPVPAVAKIICALRPA